ncbi:MAG: hypothetical protein ACREUT_12135, partial [Steroidobacteraceae bacterium]
MRKTVAGFNYALMRAGACGALLSLALWAGAAQGQAAASANALKPFHATINNICDKCHNTTDWAGGFAFDTLDLSHPGEDPEIWEN